MPVSRMFRFGGIRKACGCKSCRTLRDPDGGLYISKCKGLCSRKIKLQAFGQETRWKDQHVGELTRNAKYTMIVPQV